MFSSLKCWEITNFRPRFNIEVKNVLQWTVRTIGTQGFQSFLWLDLCQNKIV